MITNYKIHHYKLLTKTCPRLISEYYYRELEFENKELSVSSLIKTLNHSAASTASCDSMVGFSLFSQTFLFFISGRTGSVSLPQATPLVMICCVDSPWGLASRMNGRICHTCSFVAKLLPMGGLHTLTMLELACLLHRYTLRALSGLGLLRALMSRYNWCT